MKRINKNAILSMLIITFMLFSFYVQTPNLFGMEEEIKPEGIILSWQEDPKTSQTITWSTTSQEKGMIQFIIKGREAQNPNFSKAKHIQAKSIEVSPGGFYRYEETLRNLNSGTSYYYRVGNGTVWSDVSTFQTESVNTENNSFMYLGDVQFEIRDEDYKVWSDMILNAYAKHPEVKFSLLGGDYVNSSGNMKDWIGFLGAAQPVFSEIPMMTVPGNHETSILPLNYLKTFALPLNGPKGTKEEMYSFDYGNCHFIGLNTCIFMAERKNYIGEKNWNQLIEEVNAWLENDLKESNAKWKIIIMHHPAFGVSEDNEIYSTIRDNWVPLFNNAKVDLVLCGHQHVTMRTDKIDSVTYFMGNSGQKRSNYYAEKSKPVYLNFINEDESTFQIINATKKQLVLKTYNNDNVVLDQVVIEKDGK